MNTREAQKQLNKKLAFEALPPNKARVEIAKDVIAALKLRKMQARSDYVYVHAKEPVTASADGIVCLKDLLGKADQCHVCGIGSAFVAVVARDNKFQVDSQGSYAFIYREEEVKRLKPFFSSNTLDQIEAAYEGDVHSTGDFTEAFSFYNLYEDDTARLTAIMQNIVDNDGEFCP